MRRLTYLTPQSLTMHLSLRLSSDGVSWDRVGAKQATHFATQLDDGWLLWEDTDDGINILSWCEMEEIPATG